MARDSATFQDKETEVPLLSKGKKTMGQAQNLATGRDGPGEPVKIQDRSRTRLSLSLCRNPGWDAGWDAGWDRTITIPMIFCFRTSFHVLELLFPVFERPFLF